MKSKFLSLEKPSLAAYTLTELLVVLVIIGILVLLALPNFTGIIGKAYSTEAKLHLKNLHSLQQSFFFENARYSDQLADVGFIQSPLVSDGGQAKYRIEIVEATPNSYKATATAIVDFDQDGTFNIWEIDQAMKLTEVVQD